jgi:hypothetical protein
MAQAFCGESFGGGLTDKTGRGRRRTISQERRLEVMALACGKPGDGSNHWSVRKLAEATGLSIGTIHGILNEEDLKSHKVHHWCGKSPDPEFAVKQAGPHRPISGASLECLGLVRR